MTQASTRDAIWIPLSARLDSIRDGLRPKKGVVALVGGEPHRLLEILDEDGARVVPEGQPGDRSVLVALEEVRISREATWTGKGEPATLASCGICGRKEGQRSGRGYVTLGKDGLCGACRAAGRTGGAASVDPMSIPNTLPTAAAAQLPIAPDVQLHCTKCGREEGLRLGKTVIHIAADGVCQLHRGGAPAAAPTAEKTCSKCDLVKPIALFAVGQSWCRACMRVYDQERRRRSAADARVAGTDQPAPEPTEQLDHDPTGNRAATAEAGSGSSQGDRRPGPARASDASIAAAVAPPVSAEESPSTTVRVEVKAPTSEQVRVVSVIQYEPPADLPPRPDVAELKGLDGPELTEAATEMAWDDVNALLDGLRRVREERDQLRDENAQLKGALIAINALLAAARSEGCARQ